MKKHFILLVVITLAFSAQAQKNIKSIKVSYLESSEGELLDQQEPILLFTSEKTSLITSDKILTNQSSFPIEQTFVDFQLKTISKLAQFKNSYSILCIDSLALGKQKFSISNVTRKILGYNCKKATTSINSNNIELWFTNELNLKGAPTALGQDLGLVLEMVINQNSKLTANKVELLKKTPSFLSLPNSQLKIVDQLTYKDLMWKSRFINIPVFNKEIINFTKDPISNDSIFRFAGGTMIVRKVKFPDIKKGSQLFVDVTEQSNGDAYDRTGSVFLIPTDKSISLLDALKNRTQALSADGNGVKNQNVPTQNHTPLLEIMRFFTPFGVKQFNNLQLKNKTWQDSVYYRQEITELLPALNNQEVLIGMSIGNYDKGGHKASLNISIHHQDDSYAKNNWLLPLFNTCNVMGIAGKQSGNVFNNEKGLELTFEIPEGYKNFKLRYITTGHGGWENGDEFVPKKNSILVDSKEVFSFIPWRTDCGSYRLSNPASGNFSNGLSSSDISRSNWCPGTVTYPVYIDLGNLSPGKHSMQIKIPQGKPEGSNHSSWNVSGTIIGE